MNDMQKWNEYNDQTKNQPVEQMLIKALELFDGFKGAALDIGSGSGNESAYLIKNGWNVLAVDQNRRWLCECEYNGKTANGENKHWHTIMIIAKK